MLISDYFLNSAFSSSFSYCKSLIDNQGYLLCFKWWQMKFLVWSIYLIALSLNYNRIIYQSFLQNLMKVVALKFSTIFYEVIDMLRCNLAWLLQDLAQILMFDLYWILCFWKRARTVIFLRNYAYSFNLELNFYCNLSVKDVWIKSFLTGWCFLFRILYPFFFKKRIQNPRITTLVWQKKWIWFTLRCHAS